MAAIYLARHGSHALVDRILLGRSDSVGLSEKGCLEAKALVAKLEGAPMSLVQSSPRRRCRETALLVATELGAPVAIEAALDELDYGRWTGKSFDELAYDDEWRRWNEARGSTRPPGGESAAEAQTRILAHLAEAARTTGPGVLMVTHAEIIRLVMLARRGLGLNDWQSIPVAPGSLVCADAQWRRLQMRPSAYSRNEIM